MRTRAIVLLLGLITAHPLLANDPDDPCELGYNYRDTDTWGTLNPDWIQCRDGNLQSPIEVDGLSFNTLPIISVSYGQGLVKVEHTGHGLKVYPQFTATLTRSGRIPNSAFTATLKEFHFHVPVEHRISSSARAELHFVHEFPNKKQVVLAVMIEDGPGNPALEALLADPPAACQFKEPARPVNLAQLIPGELNRYLTYIGSLTTPPCTEGVLWIILSNSIKASPEQIAQLSNGQNNRKLQQTWEHQVRWR